jgi:hypothetical protein
VETRTVHRLYSPESALRQPFYSVKGKTQLEYRALSAATNEIRLLTILPAADGFPNGESPLRCLLEHATLPSGTGGPNHTPNVQFKGHSYIWPEKHAQWDISALFADKRHALAQITPAAAVKTSSNDASDINLDADLP